MREFINEFGKENFTIIAIVVLVILISLVLIVVLEKTQIKKKIKKRAKQILKNNIQKKEEVKENIQRNINKKKKIDYKTFEALKSIEKMEDTIGYISRKKLEEVEKSINNTNNTRIQKVYETPKVNKPNISTYSIPDRKETLEYPKEENNVVYKNTKRTPEEAKEKLEEVTKKLVEEKSEPDHTFFEDEQEEKSIISYDELIKASQDIDEKNDRLLEDEQRAAITLDELYKKQEKETVPKIEEKSFKKQKNSDIISPVYGRSRKPETRKQEEDLYSNIKNESSEVFLEKLKNLRSKLD